MKMRKKLCKSVENGERAFPCNKSPSGDGRAIDLHLLRCVGDISTDTNISAT